MYEFVGYEWMGFDEVLEKKYQRASWESYNAACKVYIRGFFFFFRGKRRGGGEIM